MECNWGTARLPLLDLEARVWWAWCLLPGHSATNVGQVSKRAERWSSYYIRHSSSSRSFSCVCVVLRDLSIFDTNRVIYHTYASWHNIRAVLRWVSTTLNYGLLRFIQSFDSLLSTLPIMHYDAPDGALVKYTQWKWRILSSCWACEGHSEGLWGIL